jgi:hypothetical protein
MARRNANGLVPAKGDLPEKTCAACGRPFSWRRKWARDWESVRFCSDRCRATGAADGRQPDKATPGRARRPGAG